jgi:hypothetical protein
MNNIQWKALISTSILAIVLVILILTKKIKHHHNWIIAVETWLLGLLVSYNSHIRRKLVGTI